MVVNMDRWFLTLELFASTRCRIEADIKTERGGIELRTKSDGNKLLNGVVLTCETQFEFVPTFSKAHIHEPLDPNREELFQAALRFEGVFATFGMIKLNIDEPTWEWRVQRSDGSEKELYFRYDTGFEEKPVKSEAMYAGLVTELVNRALDASSDFEALTLTLCREANNCYREYDYINCIRNGYLAIEHHCAGGQMRKDPATKAMKSSDLLERAVLNSRRMIEGAIQTGDLSRQVADQLYFERSKEEIIDLIYHARGHLFHQSGTRIFSDKWRPSDQIPHKAHAIIVWSVAMSVASEIVSSWYPTS